MPYVLLVIDMQPGFKTANRPRVWDNCFSEIQKAVQDGAHIIFLEYSLYQRTHPQFIKAASKNHIVLEKFSDDGSKEVEREVRRNKRPTTFKVCGINTDCCVLATVEGLTARFPMSKIEVVADACDSDWSHSNGLREMRKLGGYVKVI